MIFQLELSQGGVFTVRQLTGLGESLIFQQGSARVVINGDNIGLTELGSSGDVLYVYPTLFSDWQDETETPYPTKQDLLDDLFNRIFLQGADPTLPSTDVEGNGLFLIGTSAMEVIFNGETNSIIISAGDDNLGRIYVGKSDVTSLGANAVSFLAGGESLTLDYDDSSNPLYVVATIADQEIITGASL